MKLSPFTPKTHSRHTQQDISKYNRGTFRLLNDGALKNELLSPFSHLLATCKVIKKSLFLSQSCILIEGALMIQNFHLDFISKGSNIVYIRSTVQVIEHQKKNNITQTIALDEK